MTLQCVDFPHLGDVEEALGVVATRRLLLPKQYVVGRIGKFEKSSIGNFAIRSSRRLTSFPYRLQGVGVSDLCTGVRLRRGSVCFSSRCGCAASDRAV